MCWFEKTVSYSIFVQIYLLMTNHVEDQPGRPSILSLMDLRDSRISSLLQVILGYLKVESRRRDLVYGEVDRSLERLTQPHIESRFKLRRNH